MTDRAERRGRAKQWMDALTTVCVVVAVALGTSQVVKEGLQEFVYRPPGVGASPSEPDANGSAVAEQPAPLGEIVPAVPAPAPRPVTRSRHNHHGLWALWYQGALYTLAFGGVEDILYYWLDGRPLPAALPWLDRSRLIFVRPLSGDVTNLEVLASAAFWVAVWLSLLLVLPRLPASREKLKALLAAGTAAGRRVSARCAARNGGAARSNFQRSLPGRPRSPASPSAPP